jgi:uncharacterized phage protein (TIGR01671 family)
MREILFRGKATNRIEGREYRTKYKNGDWVYGLLTDVENYAGFSEMTNTNGVSGIDVDKNTVGQYTGLTDKNGKKIFEGDIVKFKRTNALGYMTSRIGEVKYYDELPIFYIFATTGDAWDWVDCEDIEVIGNIHDNPELLKEGAEE